MFYNIKTYGAANIEVSKQEWKEGHPACKKYGGMVEVGTG